MNRRRVVSRAAICSKTVSCLGFTLGIRCCEQGLLVVQRLSTREEAAQFKDPERLLVDMENAAYDRARLYLRQTEQALLAYEEGSRSFDAGFEGALCIEGTPFQKAVWRAAREIPYGETVSYGELADRIGYAGASRGVGGALHQNRMLIFIPCHRIVGSDGRMVGFGAGLDMKKALLIHERAQLELL